MAKKKTVAEEAIAEDKKEQKKGARTYQPRFQDVQPEPGEEVVEVGRPKTGKARVDQRAELQKVQTAGDVVDIWERRLINPNHHESQAIRISTPGMTIRWINLAIRGRFQRARYEQGWVPVTKDELVDEREIYGVSYTTEGYVCRGEKQSEMLMKMPTSVFKKIQRRRAELNDLSYKKLREQMGSAGHQHFKDKYGGSSGDQAAEAASNFKGSIKFGSERVSSDELFE